MTAAAPADAGSPVLPVETATDEARALAHEIDLSLLQAAALIERVDELLTPEGHPSEPGAPGHQGWSTSADVGSP